MALRPAVKLMHESAGQSDLLRGKLENTGFSEHMTRQTTEWKSTEWMTLLGIPQ